MGSGNEGRADKNKINIARKERHELSGDKIAKKRMSYKNWNEMDFS